MTWTRWAIWNWIKDSLNEDEMKEYSLSGCHWMLTPYRKLTLVHAVQQPLSKPEINKLESKKAKIGDTFTRIEGEIGLNTASTEKIEMLAQWTEPVDDLAEPGPDTLDVNGSAFVLNIDRSDSNKMRLPAKPCIEHRHEFGDTKYRCVKYYMLATSRFREYFNPELTTEEKQDYIDWKKIPGDDSEKLIELLNGNRLAKFTLAGASITKGSDENKRTIKEGSMSAVLTLNKEQNALFVHDGEDEYVYPASEDKVYKLKFSNYKLYISKDLMTRRGPVFEAKVLNSARPLSPKIEYAIPTFGWKELRSPLGKKKWQTIERKRIGGGLRIYLKRPWYSSGDGELLGVVLYPLSIKDLDELKPYVTQWGMDPIRNTIIPKEILRTSDFTAYKQTQKELTLEENSTRIFDVVGYKPEYNAERELWFFDIQMDPAQVVSYFPFIRLALAAYQPNSIPNAHLSRVVQTDFMQLANDRTLKVSLLKNYAFNVSVTGYGSGKRDGCRMEASIETLPAGANKDFGWVKVKGSRVLRNPVNLPLSPINTSTNLWKWEAIMKLPTTDRKERFRLVVKEYERYLADGNITGDRPKHANKGAERVVYMDIVEFP